MELSNLQSAKGTLYTDRNMCSLPFSFLVLEMQDKEDSDRPKSKVEAMAELRDYKRRRQSYRAKTISQSKRPAVEVYFLFRPPSRSSAFVGS